MTDKSLLSSRNLQAALKLNGKSMRKEKIDLAEFPKVPKSRRAATDLVELVHLVNVRREVLHRISPEQIAHQSRGRRLSESVNLEEIVDLAHLR